MQQDENQAADDEYVEQPLEQMADYGDEFADHIAEIEKLKQLQANNLEFLPQEEEVDSKRQTIRKRKRKSSDQINALMFAFDNNPHWSKETLLMLSIKTGLTEA